MSLISKFATVGASSMASRVLGFVREVLIAATLGAGPIADAFYAAFAFPNLFRRIFAEGAFNSAFIPLFAKELEHGGVKTAKQFAEEILAMLVAILLLLSALAMVSMPFLVSTVIAPLFSDPQKIDLTILMTRIMFPYLFCMSLVAMLSGILNAMRNYFLAAIVPVVLNIILVTVILIAIYVDAEARVIGIMLAWGVFAAGFAQLGFLLIGTKRRGFSMALKRPRMTPQVKRLLILMGPAVLTGGVIQINIMVGRVIASAQDGAIALLNYADRINQLPLGVIGIAIGVVLLPELSRALKSNDPHEVNKLQNRSLEFALLMTLPAAVAFIIMPGPIVSLLYERGAFDAQTTLATAAALAAYASGLPAYVLIKVFQPAYFAREDMRRPFYFSIFMMIINIAGSLALFPTYGHVGIAIATSVSAWVNAILLGSYLWFKSDFKPDGVSLKRQLMIILSCIAMGVFLYFGEIFLQEQFDSTRFLMRFAATLGLILAATIVYFTCIFLTGGIERKQLQRLLKRS